MLQKVFIGLLILIVAVIVMFFFKGKASHNGVAAGLDSGKLTKCSSRPNCVCSEYPDDDVHFIEALDIRVINPSQAWTKIKKIITATGGTIISEKETYLAATYTSSIFKFVDDVELRLDTNEKVIHIRSASREGYSDLGANAKRVELIRKAFNE